MLAERNVIWQRQDAPGWEHLGLHVGNDGVDADGLVVSVEKQRIFRLHYQVRCDSEWRCRNAELALLGEERGRLRLTKQGSGPWLSNGLPVERSEAAVDIDISATPFTNTLPIRRLRMSRGQSTEISALYILVPDLSVSVVAQSYRCLEKSQKEGTYIYRGLDGHEYRVTVDAEGLVTEYEGLFKTIWTSS